MGAPVPHRGDLAERRCGHGYPPASTTASTAARRGQPAMLGRAEDRPDAASPQVTAILANDDYTAEAWPAVCQRLRC